MADKTEAYNKTVDRKKVDDLVARKLELAAKIRELRAEAGKLNVDLARAGADHNIIASW